VPPQHVDAGFQRVPVLPGDGFPKRRQAGHLVQDQRLPADLRGELGRISGLVDSGAPGIHAVGSAGQFRGAEPSQQADREACSAQADRAP
jgi:hypothetical protein